MIKFADDFIKCFFSEYSPLNREEDDLCFQIEFSTGKYSRPLATELVMSTDIFLQEGDELHFSIKFGQADPIMYSSVTEGTFSLLNFLTKLSTEYMFQENESIRATLTIDKKKIGNSISIYDLDLFTDTIEKRTIKQGFFVFDRAFSKSSFVNFNVLGLDKEFCTDTIYFTPVGQPISRFSSVDRLKILEMIKPVSYYSSIEKHSLSPHDFNLQIKNLKHNNLCLLFERYSLALSVIYLFDITSLHESEIEYKLNGYKSISGKFDVKVIPIKDLGNYFKIYEWVYNGGNLNDKIGLARNIISLHFVKSGEIALKGDPFQSIQSSYKVYEKQNIKQYLEIRNKISDQLLEFNNRANKLIESFASDFRRSAFALTGFYISSIVLKVFSGGNFTNVFTFDVVIISTAFLLSSLIYGLLSRREVKGERKRFVESYENLKERYTDLLDSTDIQRILNNDKEFNSDLKFIDEKLKSYSWMWFSFLLVVFVATVGLFFTYNLPQLFNTPIWRFFFGHAQ